MLFSFTVCLFVCLFGCVCDKSKSNELITQNFMYVEIRIIFWIPKIYRILQNVSWQRYALYECFQVNFKARTETDIDCMDQFKYLDRRDMPLPQRNVT